MARGFLEEGAVPLGLLAWGRVPGERHGMRLAVGAGVLALGPVQGRTAQRGSCWPGGTEPLQELVSLLLGV